MPEITPHKNYDLSRETTFKVGCISDNVFVPASMSEFCDTLILLENPAVIGAGSNTIISSDCADFPIIITKKLNELKIEGNTITAQCGVKTALLSQKACEANLSGLEFLTCIPASVGGVVLMNASAHKQAIKDVILGAKVFDLETKQVIELNKDELELDYRSSVLQSKKYIALEATFALDSKDKESIQKRMDENKAYRNAHHPSMKTPNAGSTFRNPKDAVSGRLIEQSGLKGVTFGGAKVSEIHANFIVNYDNATSFDILSLMSLVQDEVQKKYGYKLQPEVKYIGSSEKEEKLWQKLNS